MPSSMPRPARRIGHDQGARVRQPHTGRGRHRGLDVDLLGPHIPGRLVREEGDQLVGEPPEGRGVGALVAQRGEFVRHQRVVDDVDPHAVNSNRAPDRLLAGPHWHQPPVRREGGGIRTQAWGGVSIARRGAAESAAGRTRRARRARRAGRTWRTRRRVTRRAAGAGPSSCGSSTRRSSCATGSSRAAPARPVCANRCGCVRSAGDAVPSAAPDRAATLRLQAPAGTPSRN